jgi:hypothetical protein
MQKDWEGSLVIGLYEKKMQVTVETTEASLY